jgi:hypothetical protein
MTPFPRGKRFSLYPPTAMPPLPCEPCHENRLPLPLPDSDDRHHRCPGSRAGRALQHLHGSAARRSPAKGVSTASFDRLTSGLTPDMSVLEFLDYQPEFRTPIWDYLAGLVDDERVADALAMREQWATYAGQGSRALSGRCRHGHRRLGRRKQLRTQLRQTPAAHLARHPRLFRPPAGLFPGRVPEHAEDPRHGDIAPERLVGSWAGAFGHTQFMPSTFLRLAVDGDGDGRRDLMDSVPDALASTANFLHRAGWRKASPGVTRWYCRPVSTAASPDGATSVRCRTGRDAACSAPMASRSPPRMPPPACSCPLVRAARLSWFFATST